METHDNKGSLVFGALLLAAGLFLLLGQVFGPNLGGETWPLIIIGFGGLFFIAMLAGGRRFSGLAIPGSIIAGIGAILLVQNTFRLWETWSYAWALVICAVGIGIFISGIWGQDANQRRSGANLTQLGLTLFVIFGIIFEAIFSISGITASGSMIWPILLIFAGLMMLIARSYRLLRPQSETEHHDTNLFWPIIFIGVGVLWLGINTGRLPAGNLAALINLWPILLVAAGVNILLGRRWQWMNLLFGALVVAGMFYVVYNSDRLGLSTRPSWGILGINFNNDDTPVSRWITGSGNVTEKAVQIGDINEINLHGYGDLEIHQGKTPGLVIRADDNIIEYIDTRESGNRLTIGIETGVGITSSETLRYILTVKDLRRVSVSGSASISGSDLQVDDLELALSGLGKVTLNHVTADELTVRISGSGNVVTDGSANRLDVNISGAGGINSPDLQVKDAYINISGVGRAVLWVTDRLEPRISGVGSVSYYGEPDVDESTSGIGNIRNLGNK